MHRNLLNQYIESDSRQAARILLASLESIEATETQEDRTRQAVEEATTLADRLARQHPDNVELHQSMVAVLENMGATQGINVSNEGLLDIASKLSGFWRKRKPDSKNLPDEEKASGRDMDRVIREFLTEMEKTYLNPSWVSKQKFVEGNIPAKDFSGKFQIDGKPVTDPLANIEQHRKSVSAFIGSWNGVLKALDSQVQAIDKRVTSEAKRLSSSDEEAALNVVRNAVKQMKAVSDPVKLAGSHFKLMANSQTAIKQWRYSGDPGANCDGAISVAIKPVAPMAEVPAVSKEMVKPLIDAIISIYQTTKMIEERMPYWCDHSDGEHGFMKILEARDELLWSQYGNEMYWQGQARRLVWDLGLEKNSTTAVIAVLKWIDRSIKTQ